MANTFTALHVHLVFSTKNRERWLRAEVEDHVHLLLGVPPTLALSDLVKRLKGESSKWLSAEVKGMKGFAWQDGYGAFTVGKSQIVDTICYIQTQREHHQGVTFEDEYRKFLKLHTIEAEEKYIFG